MSDITGGHLRDEDLIGLLRDEMRQDQAYAWLVHCESCSECGEKLAAFRTVHSGLGMLAEADRPALCPDAVAVARERALLALRGGYEPVTTTSARNRVVKREFVSQWTWVFAAAASVLIGLSIVIAEAVSHNANDEVDKLAEAWETLPQPEPDVDDDRPRPVVRPRRRREPARVAQDAPRRRTLDFESPDELPEIEGSVPAVTVAQLIEEESAGSDFVPPAPAADATAPREKDAYIAYLDATTGQVEFRRSGETEWHPCAQGMPLMGGDRLRTAMSRARVFFYSGTTLDINRFADLTFGERAWPAGIAVTKGEVYVETADLDHGFYVTSPHGKTVDLGTRFDVEVGPVTGTSVVVVEGRVEASTDIGTARLRTGTEVHLASRRAAPSDVKPVLNLQKRLAWTMEIPTNRPRNFASVNLIRGMVGYWRFDEARGPLAYDSSGNGFVGRLISSPGRTFGYAGGSLYFGGAKNYVRVETNDAFSFSDGLTVAAWLRLDRIDVTQRIAGRHDARKGGYKLCVQGGKLDLAIMSPVGDGDPGPRATWLTGGRVAGGTVLPTGEWVHVVGTYSDDGDYIRTYLNGALDRELRTDVRLRPSAGPFFIGRQTYANIWHLCGQMDELILFGRALSETEIRMLSRWPSPR